MPRNKPRSSTYEPRQFPWLTGKKTRAERVIAFLEFLQVTKGMKRGSKLRLLAHQREFVERVYADGVEVRLAVSSVGRGNGKMASMSMAAIIRANKQAYRERILLRGLR